MKGKLTSPHNEARLLYHFIFGGLTDKAYTSKFSYLAMNSLKDLGCCTAVIIQKWGKMSNHVYQFLIFLQSISTQSRTRKLAQVGIAACLHFHFSRWQRSKSSAFRKIYFIILNEILIASMWAVESLSRRTALKIKTASSFSFLF